MLDFIRIENFKWYADQEFGLAQLTLLVGMNAAGKTSVIQALLLADEAVRSKRDVISIQDVLHTDINDPYALVKQDKPEVRGDRFSFTIGNRQEEARIDFSIHKEQNLVLQRDIQGEFSERMSYLNAERLGPRANYTSSDSKRMAYNGSNASYIIDQADTEAIAVDRRMWLNGQGGVSFSFHVERWLRYILENISDDVNDSMRFSVESGTGRGMTSVHYSNSLAPEGVLPPMTGFGLSYVLPIITAVLWSTTEASEEKIILMENPEAHLHPGAQSRMGYFLAQAAASGIQLIVETHSEHIVDGARLFAAERHGAAGILVKYMQKAGRRIVIEDLAVKDDGDLPKWPDGFFDQKTLDLIRLHELKKRNENK